MKLNKLTASLMLMGLSPLALADFKIQDIRVEGLQHTEPATVFNYLPVKVGDTFTDESGSEIIQRLFATGLFDDVRVESAGQQVLLTVIERPVVSNLTVEGGKLIQNDVIRKNLDAFGLGKSQPFNQNTLNEAVSALKDEYRKQGKYDVEITQSVDKLARNRVAVKLTIDEGKTTTIADIAFVGNQVFSDRKLRKQMSLSEDGMWTWFTKSNRFNPEKFNQDLERINVFYHNQGYFDFYIADAQVDTDEAKNKQTVKITVSEGRRYRWGKVGIAGDTREVPLAELQAFLTMKEGKWYDRSQLMAALERIQNRMASSGYAFSEINVQPQPDAETGIVNITLQVEPGRKMYVNQIHISGNNKTRDEVIRREVRQMEAAPYDLSKLQRSKERVEQLGYFDNVQFDAVPRQDTPDQVDLDMRVTERSTGSLDFSAGYVQGTGLVLSAGVAQDNLFGTGKSVAARLSRSKTTQNASLSFTDPYFTPEGVSMGYDVYGKSYDPRKSSNNQYKTTNYGVGLRMGVPVTEYDRVNFGMGLERMGVDIFPGAPKLYREFIEQHGNVTRRDFGVDQLVADKNGGYQCPGENGKVPCAPRPGEVPRVSNGKFSGVQWKGTVGWGRNKTDSALWPTTGYLMDVNLEAGLPGSKLTYYSLNHNQKWFFPLTKDMTLMLGGSLGYANRYGKTKQLPFFENFHGGGLGSVRGYESSTLGPKVYDNAGNRISYGGNRMVNGSAELLFPFPGVKEYRTVRLSLFADAGSVWDGKTYTAADSDNNKSVYGGPHRSTFKNELRYSAGAAVTWLSPIGPLKLSYGYPLKKKQTDEIQRFQFQLGTTF